MLGLASATSTQITTGMVAYLVSAHTLAVRKRLIHTKQTCILWTNGQYRISDARPSKFYIPRGKKSYFFIHDAVVETCSHLEAWPHASVMFYPPVCSLTNVCARHTVKPKLSQEQLFSAVPCTSHVRLPPDIVKPMCINELGRQSMRAQAGSTCQQYNLCDWPTLFQVTDAWVHSGPWGHAMRCCQHVVPAGLRMQLNDQNQWSKQLLRFFGPDLIKEWMN